MDIGAQLRTAREAQGLSLGSIAQKTRVRARILTAIESNDLPAIPPKPFGRGFVRAYARELGLDPEQTVNDYFAQFPPVVQEAPPRKPVYEPPRTSWFVPLTSVAVLAILIASALRGGDPATEPSTPAPVGTSGTEPLQVPPRDAAPADPAATAAQSPNRSGPSELNVVLTTNAESWVTATADGDRVVYRLLSAGSRESLRATREISVRAGNAGGVALTINGRPAGTLGRAGEVRTLRINPENASSIGPPGGEDR
jgi:cytoskeletal protein RodZ